MFYSSCGDIVTIYSTSILLIHADHHVPPVKYLCDDFPRFPPSLSESIERTTEACFSVDKHLHCMKMKIYSQEASSTSKTMLTDYYEKLRVRVPDSSKHALPYLPLLQNFECIFFCSNEVYYPILSA